MHVTQFLIEMLTVLGAARQDADYADFRNDSVFNDKIAGKTFIDIGSHHGELCLEALRRGATRAVGVELIRENVLIARQKAEQTGLSPEYLEADFERIGDLGSFDVVACLNVLPQLFDPIHALRRMAAMARERLVLELPNQPSKLFSRFRTPGPAIDVPWARRMHEVAGRTFLPNVAAMEGIFNQHMATFEPVQIVPSKPRNSFLVVATKRRIKHLTVVAGPTSSGKSTFKNRLISDQAFRVSLGLPEGVTAQADANEIRRLPDGRLDHVVLHYDFFRPYDRALGTYERDPAAEFIRCAEHLSIFTMMTPKARIRSQLAVNELNKKRMKPDAKVRYEGLYVRYDSPDFLASWYDKWFRFCATLDHNRHRLARNDGNYEFFDSADWQRIHAANYGEIDDLKPA
ncbi:methyltransferase domain-containing protein [Mesorhizobium sp. M0684]|uniref:methyltransferase domain-containing protein n=1 Tax=unclassified Mesorhizobium TaxID=325217 RepID=UPI00333628DF